MKTLRIFLAAVLALAPVASASALDRLLPAPRIKDNGDVRLSDDLKIGRYRNGKYVATPDTLEVGSTIQSGGPDGVTPSVSGLDYQFYLRRYATGSSTVGRNLSLQNVEGDSASITGANFLNYWTVQGNLSSSSIQGGRQGIYGLLTQTSPTSANNLNRNYVAGAFNFTSYSGDGGFGLDPDDGVSPTRAKGGGFGINPVAILGCLAPGTCATNWNNLTAGEINIAAQIGTSLNYKSGIQISSLGSDRVQGRDVDAMISLSNQAGAIGWKDGLLFGAQNGGHPIAADGYLLRSSGAGRANVAITAAGVVQTSNLSGSGNRPVYADANGTLTNAGPTSAPASATSPCVAGAITYDTAYAYFCVATNNWRRTALSTW